MSGIVCYDSAGNLLSKLYQWDVNQTIVIKGLDTSLVYEFQFCHQCDSQARVVIPDVYDDRFEVHIPNILLTSSAPIIMYICLNIGTSSTRTVHKVHIPVEPRPEPEDYKFEENIDYVSWVALVGEAEGLISEMGIVKDECVAATNDARDAISNVAKRYIVPFYDSSVMTDEQKAELISIADVIRNDTGDYSVLIQDSARLIPACYLKDRNDSFTAVFHGDPAQIYTITIQRKTTGDIVTATVSPYVLFSMDDVKTGYEIPSASAVMKYVEAYVQEALNANASSEAAE